MVATTGWSADADQGTEPGGAGSSTAKARRGWPRRVLGWLLATVCGVVVAGIAALAIGLTVVPAVGGGHTLTVLSGSMTPRLPVGSVVVDRPVNPNSLKTGDIVTYADGHNLITHRVVAVRRGSHGRVFTTKGDANNSADAKPVRAAQIRGELWYDVPYIGTVRNFLTTKAGLTAIGGAVVLIGAVWFLVRLNRPAGDGGES